uniref:Uncharacterized protein n=1 Tax=Arundo donax TaxID=35708 RepID=A0A0A8XWG5_ARUDO
MLPGVVRGETADG